MVSSAAPLTAPPNDTVRSPVHGVSLTRDYAPTAGPEVLSLGADVDATTSTPEPTGGIVKSLPVGARAAVVPPVGGDDAYGAYAGPFDKQFFYLSFVLWASDDADGGPLVMDDATAVV